MKKHWEQHTELEKQALSLASLILSYSPQSAFANLYPDVYAMFYARARAVMLDVGIVPDENIRCWFWQLDTYTSGRNNDKHLKRARQETSPRLNIGLNVWEHPVDGHRLSDAEFVHLWRN